MKTHKRFFLSLAVMFAVSLCPLHSQTPSGDPTSGGTSASTQTTTTNNAVNVNSQSVLALPAVTMTPQYANGLMVNTAGPTLFQQNGLPASADGLIVTRFFYSLVPDVYVKGNEVLSSKKGGYQYTFVPVGVNYTENRDFKNNHTEDVRTLDVTALDPAPPGKCFLYPIGLIQCEALAKKAGEVSSASMFSGLNAFVAKELKGHSNYRILYYPAQLGANIGVVSSGKGFGVSPGASGFMQSTLTGVLGGFGTNSGLTYTQAMPHLTAMVFVEVKGEPDKQWPAVDLSVLQPKPPAPAVAEKPATNTKVTVDLDLEKAISAIQK